jgi:hypothetical protein
VRSPQLSLFTVGKKEPGLESKRGVWKQLDVFLSQELSDYLCIANWSVATRIITQLGGGIGGRAPVVDGATENTAVFGF